ncbi:MAG TPA: FecR family protein [Geminicoccaceae bacterium]|nr:FecR family protein [Geminicoccaceae bacterium]
MGSDRRREPGREPNRRRALRLAALILVVLWAEPPLAQGVRSIGSVSELVGRCLVSRHGETEVLPLMIGTELFEGDSVRTAVGARLKLEFIDGSVVQLGESTDIALDWFLHAPEEQTQNVLLRASAGIFRVIAQLLLPRSAFVVETPTAAASVRGTDWIVEATSGATAIVVLDGQVAVRNVAAGVPGEVTLQPGEGTTVEAGRAARPPSVWGDARRDSFIARTAVP